MHSAAMEVESRTVLGRLEFSFFLGAVGLVFASFHITSYPVLILLWAFATGVLTAHVLFRALPTTPNILLHLRQPPKKSPRRRLRAQECPVCGQTNCSRHKGVPRKDFLKPWDELTLPASIDDTLTEFFEIVMHRFVYSWQRNLFPGEAFANELRVAIRYAAASFLRRAQEVDIPAVIMGKMVQVAVAHLHLYLRVRKRLPRDASTEDIEKAVLSEYGDHTHLAMRGKTANLRYFRQLTASVLPHLLPEDALQSKIMSTFIHELFAAKVLVPAMDFAAKPDFISRILLLVFDKNSRLQQYFGPPSRDVPLLARFARRRTTATNPLHTFLSDLLQSQSHLYSFLAFLRAHDAVHILQLLLALGELNKKCSSPDEARKVVSEIKSLHSNHLSASSPQKVPLSPSLIRDLEAVLSPGASPEAQWHRIEELGIISRAYDEVFTMLEETYLPDYHRSPQFFELYVKTPPSGQTGPTKDKGGQGIPRQRHRWPRPPTTAPSLDSINGQASSFDSELLDGEFGDENAVMVDAPPPTPLPYQVQIVDSESVSEGLRPYVVYVILTRREGEAAKTSVITVKRRFKEFVVLDSKLRHFYGDIGIQLPSKRPVRNMDAAFVRNRMRELELYLQKLITLPKIQDSQLLITFLTDLSDPALFIPDSVSNKAGKMMKAVPGRSKKVRSQHIDEFLQGLLLSVEVSPPQASPQTMAEVTALEKANNERVERYRKEVAEDLSDSESQRSKPWLRRASFGPPLEVKTFMDLVVYLAVHVYDVTQWQLAAVLVLKLLGQSSMDALVYNFIADKVRLLEQEEKVVQIIHLLRDNLFFNEDQARSSVEVWRQREALALLLRYPPDVFLRVLGEDRYHQGTTTVFEMLQCHELNKQLFFNFLDVIVLELFPELQSDE